MNRASYSTAISITQSVEIAQSDLHVFYACVRACVRAYVHARARAPACEDWWILLKEYN